MPERSLVIALPTGRGEPVAIGTHRDFLGHRTRLEPSRVRARVAIGQSPQECMPVVTACHHLPPVARECHTLGSFRGHAAHSVRDGLRLACGQIPEYEFAVPALRDEPMLIRAEAHA
jgi:hypothetical protein